MRYPIKVYIIHMYLYLVRRDHCDGTNASGYLFLLMSFFFFLLHALALDVKLAK